MIKRVEVADMAAAGALAAARGIDPSYLVNAVASGEAKAFDLFDGERRQATVIITVADDPMGRDLVALGVDMATEADAADTNQMLVDLAAAAGLDGVRCWTGRLSMVRRLQSFGWRDVSRMMRVGVRHVQ